MCIICILLYIASEKWHIIYLQLQVQARARKFYAADCNLVLRSRCIARRLLCTQQPALRTNQPDMHPALPALRAPVAPLLHHYDERDPVCILACSTRPLQRRPPARCSLSLPRDEDCSGRQREARTVGERLGRLVDERRRPKRQRPRLLAPPTPMDGMQDKIFFKNLDRINFRLI